MAWRILTFTHFKMERMVGNNSIDQLKMEIWPSRLLCISWDRYCSTSLRSMVDSDYIWPEGTVGT